MAYRRLLGAIWHHYKGLETMNRREAERLNHQESVLLSLGFTADEATKLRRISNTLHRWYELECGTGDDDGTSRSIERDELTGKPFVRVQYQNRTGWHDMSWPTPDSERGAENRLAAIIQHYNTVHPFHTVTSYLQTDPRGAALYILRPGDVPEGEEPSAYYSRGICVY